MKVKPIYKILLIIFLISLILTVSFISSCTSAAYHGGFATPHKHNKHPSTDLYHSGAR